MKSTLILLFLLSTNLFAKESYIVLIPGAASSGDQFWLKGMGVVYDPFHLTKYFKNLEEILESEGHKVITCPYTKDKDSRSSLERAQDCYYYLSIRTLLKPDSEFHIIGHSMGGIVGRQLLHKFTNGIKIKSLTTISTPHEGSPLANFSIHHHESKSIIGKALKIMDFTPVRKRYLKELAMFKHGSRYLQGLGNPTQVPIYSISNHRKLRFYDLLATPSHFLKKEMKKVFDSKKIDLRNDGIVPAVSMIYGEHLGHINADHIESGCLFVSQNSKGCDQMLNILLPHLYKVTR